jgi:predicted XRE-type DNA-binding protein
MKIDKEQLEEIKRWLKHGDQELIAGKLNVDASRVSQVLSGGSPNLEILEACIEKAIERKAKIVNGMSRLKQLQ